MSPFNCPRFYADLRSVTTLAKPVRIVALVYGLTQPMEVGYLFKLGYKYTNSMGARVLDKNGKEVTPIMGRYGIGIERILTAPLFDESNDE